MGWGEQRQAGTRNSQHALGLSLETLLPLIPSQSLHFQKGWPTRAPGCRMSVLSESGPPSFPPHLAGGLQPTVLFPRSAPVAGAALGAPYLFMQLLSAAVLAHRHIL